MISVDLFSNVVERKVNAYSKFSEFASLLTSLLWGSAMLFATLPILWRVITNYEFLGAQGDFVVYVWPSTLAIVLGSFVFEKKHYSTK